MDLTANYNLGKPLGTEDYDVGVPNANMDIIDGLLKARADGETALDGRVDALDGRVDALEGDSGTSIHHAVLIASAAQSIPNTTDTKIAFPTTPHSIFGCTYSDADDEVTITVAGLYHLTGSVGFVANTTNGRYCSININGSTIAESSQNGDPGTFNITNVSAFRRLAVNDKVTLEATQNSGAALLTTSDNGRTQLGLARLGA